MHDMLRGDPQQRELFNILLSAAELPKGVLPITKIVDQVHFAPKHGAALLQIADSCAFAIRYALQSKQGAQPVTDALAQGNSVVADQLRRGMERGTDAVGGHATLAFDVAK